MLKSNEMKSLLYFIGCLPAGVTLKQLNKMWGEQNVTKDLPGLMKMNLVEKAESKSALDGRYELNPVLCQYIEQDAQ